MDLFAVAAFLAERATDNFDLGQNIHLTFSKFHAGPWRGGAKNGFDPGVALRAQW